MRPSRRFFGAPPENGDAVSTPRGGWENLGRPGVFSRGASGRAGPLLCGAALLGAILWMTAPAALLAHWGNKACGERCRVAAPEGALTQGQAMLWLRSGPSSGWRPAGRMTWRVALDGVHLTLGGGQLRLLPGWRGIDVHGAGVVLAADSVLPLLPGLPRDGWQGRVGVDELQALLPWSGGLPAGQGTVRWLGAASQMAPGLVLGDYRLRFRLDGGAAHAELDTLGGALLLAGQGEWKSGRWQAEIVGQVTQAPARPLLEPILRTLGRPVPGAEGRFRVKLP